MKPADEAAPVPAEDKADGKAEADPKRKADEPAAAEPAAKKQTPPKNAQAPTDTISTNRTVQCTAL